MIVVLWILIVLCFSVMALAGFYLMATVDHTAVIHKVAPMLVIGVMALIMIFSACVIDTIKESERQQRLEAEQEKDHVFKRKAF